MRVVTYTRMYTMINVSHWSMRDATLAHPPARVLIRAEIKSPEMSPNGS